MNITHPQNSKQIILTSASFYGFFYGSIAAALPFLNVYFDELGLSGAQIGWRAALQPLSVLFIAPIVSLLADRLAKRRRFLQVGVLVAAVFIFLLGYASSYSTILVVSIGFAIFFGALVPLGDSLIVRASNKNGLNFGSLRLWGSIIFSLIVILSGRVWLAVGYRPMFIIMPLLMLPAIWLAGQFSEPEKPQAQGKSPISADLLKSIFPLLTIVFLAGISLSVAANFDSLLITSLGGNSIHVGLIFGIAAGVEVPIMFYSNRIAQRLGGYTRVFGLALILFAITMTGYIFSQTPTIALFFGGLRGASFACLLVSGIQLFDQRVPNEQTATAQTMRTAAMFGIAPLIATVSSGYILDAFGIHAVFVLGLVSALLALAVLAWSLLTKRLVEVA